MQRTMLKSKIHRATVTDANVDYEGSVSIDRLLMEAADLRPFEQVQIYNVTNGERLTTYVIEAARGSGEICVNGAAARRVSRGDIVIIASYIGLEEAEAEFHQPKLVYVDRQNQMLETSETIRV
ncbi:MAG: aspartate 1-decarboxylase [Deltaproteobacteria bacterium]|nr:aspartate 1-decarboxylase [Deltaproteobacteria bacterium]